MESQLPDQILNQVTAVKAWNPNHSATRSSRYSLKPHEQSCLVQGPLFFWLSLSDVISPRALFIIHVAWRTLNFVVRAWSHSRASGWVPPTPARSPQSKALESDMLQQNSQLPTHTPAPPESFLRITNTTSHWGSIILQVFCSWSPQHPPHAHHPGPGYLRQSPASLPNHLPSNLLSTPQPGSSFKNANLFIHVTSLQRRKTVLRCLPIYYYKGEALNLTSCSKWRVLFILLETLHPSVLPPGNTSNTSSFSPPWPGWVDMVPGHSSLGHTFYNAPRWLVYDVTFTHTFRCTEMSISLVLTREDHLWASILSAVGRSMWFILGAPAPLPIPAQCPSQMKRQQQSLPSKGHTWWLRTLI